MTFLVDFRLEKQPEPTTEVCTKTLKEKKQNTHSVSLVTLFGIELIRGITMKVAVQRTKTYSIN